MFLGTEHSCGEGMKDLQMDTMVKTTHYRLSFYVLLDVCFDDASAGLKMVARTAGCIHLDKTSTLVWQS